MRGSLCAHFIDAMAWPGDPPCTADGCPGPAHVRVLATIEARRLAVPPGTLLRHFGSLLFERLRQGYPAFFVGVQGTLELLGEFETRVAAPLRELQPTLPLPTVVVVRRPRRPITVIFHAPCDLEDVLEGMVAGSIAAYREPWTIVRAWSVRVPVPQTALWFRRGGPVRANAPCP